MTRFVIKRGLATIGTDENSGLDNGGLENSGPDNGGPDNNRRAIAAVS